MKKHTLHKALSMLLTAALALNLGLTAAFAEGTTPPDRSSICTDHTEHTDGDGLPCTTALLNTSGSSAEIWDGTTAAEGIDYTLSGDTYTILTPVGLAWIGTQIQNVPPDPQTNHNWSYFYNFILGANLDLSGRKWIPIDCMWGDFDGNGKTITGLTITTEGSYLGLFANLSNNANKMVVKDLTVKGDIVISDATTKMNIGMLSGSASVKVEIENCRTEGTIRTPNTTGEVTIGGLIGDCYTSSVKSCSSSVAIHAEGAKGEIGGLLGFASPPISITDCYATGNVVGGMSSGGLIGYVGTESAVIRNCFATGDVSAENESAYVGGLIGYNYDASTISNCYSMGNVSAVGTGSGIASAAGIMGHNNSGQISNCYSLGTATATGAGTTIAGGIVGNNANGIVEVCYALGAISASGSTDLRVGGIVGNQAGSNPQVKGCVALSPSVTGSAETNNAVAGQVTSGAVVGRLNGTLTNNRAFAGILVNGAAVERGDLTDKHGLAVSGDSIGDFSAFGAFDTSSWTMTDGKLPALTGVTQEALDVPNYIIPKPTLTVTVSDASRAYGAKNPTPTVAFEGFLDGDGTEDLTGTLAFTYAASITSESAPGVYEDVITASGLQSERYKIVYRYAKGTGADLTITKIPVRISAGSANASQLTIHLSEPLAGLTTNAFTVTLDNAPVALTGIAASGDNQTYTLNGSFTLGRKYSVTVSTTSAVHEIVGNPLSITPGEPASGGDNGSTVTPPTVVTPPATPENPNPPTTVETTVGSKTGKDGSAAVTVPGQDIASAIKKAQAESKKRGTEENGIGIVLNVKTDKNATSLETTFSNESVQALIQAGATELTVKNSLSSVTFDLDALKALAGGEVTLTIGKVDTKTLSEEARAAIGSRPVYQFSATVGGKTVSDFGGGSAGLQFPYTPKGNEQADRLWAVYVDGDGKLTWLEDSRYDASRGLVLASTPHFSVYGVGYREKTTDFADTAGHWAKADIDFVVARGLLNGTTATTFSPNTSMTRGMFVTALGRLAGIETKGYESGGFTDVRAEAYYAPYVAWASASGIASGTGNATFSPDKAITRQAMAAMLVNYSKVMGHALPDIHPEAAFADGANVASWARNAVRQTQMAGILMGKSGNRFDPTATATRAQVAAMLHRYMDVIV